MYIGIYIYITYVYGVWPQQFDLKLFSDSRVVGFPSSFLQIAMFRELLRAPGELRAEEVDAAGAKLREHVELNQCGKLFRVLSNQVELPSLTLSVQEKRLRVPLLHVPQIGLHPLQPRLVRAAPAEGREGTLRECNRGVRSLKLKSFRKLESMSFCRFLA